MSGHLPKVAGLNPVEAPDKKKPGTIRFPPPFQTVGSEVLGVVNQLRRQLRRGGLFCVQDKILGAVFSFILTAKEFENVCRDGASVAVALECTMVVQMDGL